MRRIYFGVLAVLGAALAAAPAMAHHSFAAEYDSKKPVKITGTVTKIDWMNPHVYFFMDVEDANGKVTQWGFEMGPPNLLQNAGWTRNTMKIGDVVVVDGTLAKDGTNQGNARAVTLASTGKRLGAASSENTTP
ncbi:MAG TPA: DUF6152 family protein [Bryobacteraceae bacterium]